MRYSFALVVVYIAFLAGVRFWMWCLFGPALRRHNVRSDDGGSDWNFRGWSGGSSRGSGISAPSGGGGRSGGAGASGSWHDSSQPAPVALVTHSSTATVDSGSSSGGGKSSSGGSISAGDSDSGKALGCLAALLIVLAIIAFVASIGYVIYIAPHMLSDAAFQFLLAGGLLNHARNADADWMESVFKATWCPFTIIFVVTLAFAGAAGSYYPHAHTMLEVSHATGWF